MDKSIFKKYIEEMKMMKAAAMPEPKTFSYPTTYQNPENMEGMGELRVQVTTVRGLYPVKNAKITIFANDHKNMNILAEGNTDQSGSSPLFSLPAPSAALADTPDATSRPYALYNILTEADGFKGNYNYNVAVFDQITSLQTVELIPLNENPILNEPIIIDEYEEYSL